MSRTLNNIGGLCYCSSFLQGPETDPTTVSKIRDAVRDQKEVTVQLINYTKSGMISFPYIHVFCYSR